MPDPSAQEKQSTRYTAQSVAQQAPHVLGTKLSEKDLLAVTSLLNGLASDMRTMLAMPVDENEPAVIYQASLEDL
jgi:hypothetical protein